MNKTAIEWTTFSANPLKYRRKSDGKAVWSCVKTSPGCARCYSEAIALRFDRGRLFNAANMEELEPFLDEAELHKMMTAKTIGGVQVSGSRCFVADMTDAFGEWVPDELLDRLFAVFKLRPDVTFQVLTKRAERMATYVADGHRNKRGEHTDMFITREAFRLAEQTGIAKNHAFMDSVIGVDSGWPKNVWAGVSVENQRYADERIPHLLATPAAVRFLSCEPLLGPVVPKLIDRVQPCPKCGETINPEYHNIPCCCWKCGNKDNTWKRLINLVIVGGESGHGARPMHPDWARSIRDQCQAAKVPFFFKQWGEFQPNDQMTDEERIIANATGKQWHAIDATLSLGTYRVGKKNAGRLLDGRTWNEFPEAPA